MNKRPCNLLFVYGTLRQDEGNASLMEGLECLGLATAKGLALWDKGSFPCAWPSFGDEIVGEVYRVNDWTSIDRLEGNPNWYCRKKRVVRLDDNRKIIAWIYLLKPSKADTLIPSGDWLNRPLRKAPVYNYNSWKNDVAKHGKRKPTYKARHVDPSDLLPELVLAYGSNMDESQMRQRCPSAIKVRSVYLKDYRLTFTGRKASWRGGVGAMVESPGDYIPAVVWEITRQDLRILDSYEGHPHVYSRELSILSGDQVWLYLHNDPTDFCEPSAEYLARIETGYRAAGFSDKVERLRFDAWGQEAINNWASCLAAHKKPVYLGSSSYGTSYSGSLDSGNGCCYECGALHGHFSDCVYHHSNKGLIPVDGSESTDYYESLDQALREMNQRSEDPPLTVSAEKGVDNGPNDQWYGIQGTVKNQRTAD